MNNTGRPGRLWSRCPCRCSKPDWTWPWATCSDWRCWTRQMISTGAFWPLLCCTSCENTPQKFTKFLGAMQRVVDSYGGWSLLNTCKMAWGICMKVLEYFYCNDNKVTKIVSHVTKSVIALKKTLCWSLFLISELITVESLNYLLFTFHKWNRIACVLFFSSGLDF